MTRVYLLAHPAGHSVSPAMHNAAFAHLGLEFRYEALDVSPQRLGEAVELLRGEGVAGANVTIPHKQAVMSMLDRISVEAKAVGAVNTIIADGGTLSGHNTDAAGFLKALSDDAKLSVKDKRTLILGAGGAARAVAYALVISGAKVAIHNRTEERARSLIRDFGRLGELTLVEHAALAEAVRSADLLVNTTSVGMQAPEGDGDAEESPLQSGILPENGLVCDLVYRPMETRLLREAKRAGLPVLDGLPMLVYQGAIAFELWTARAAPVEVMLEAAKRELAVG